MWPGLQLVEETQSKTPAALFIGYAERAVRLAYHLTGDREAALDLSQDAFVRAMEALPELREQRIAEFWFNQIVVNLCRDWRRRRQRERKVPPAVLRRDRCDDPAWRAETVELSERARAALLELEPDYREAVALVAVEGCAPKEAAAILGLPEGTLRWRLHQGRAQLKRTLGLQDEESSM